MKTLPSYPGHALQRCRIRGRTFYTRITFRKKIMRQPRSVLVYPVKFVNQSWNWEYLLLHRVPRPDLGMPDFWQGISGAIQRNETLEQAAAREVIEETGFKRFTIVSSNYSYAVSLQEQWCSLYPSGVKEIQEHVFLAFTDEKQDPVLSEEHDFWQWCSLETALGLLKYPGNVEAMKRCSMSLSNFLSEISGVLSESKV